MLLQVIAEDNNNVLADVFVHFFDDKDRWILKGRWSGYNVQGKGYIEVPYVNKMYDEDEVGEQFTKNHDKLSRRKMRNIWDSLQEDGFELEEHLEDE